MSINCNSNPAPPGAHRAWDRVATVFPIASRGIPRQYWTIQHIHSLAPASPCVYVQHHTRGWGEEGWLMLLSLNLYLTLTLCLYLGNRR
jgi:hypothetical protein